MSGLSGTVIDVLVRQQRSDGTAQVVRLTPSAASFVVEDALRWTAVAATYLGLGIEHILFGIDHLLFVLALLLLVRSWRRLVATVTALIVAHSITLAAATFGFVHVPSQSVEAAIALNIVFVAVEIVHGRTGRMLAGLEVGQAGDDPVRAERVLRRSGLSSIAPARGRPCSTWRRSRPSSASCRAATCSTNCATTVASSPRWSTTRAPAPRCVGRSEISAWRAAPVLAGHHLRGNRVALRRVIDRALEARVLQRDAGRTDLVDRVVLVQGVARAWQLLTGKPLVEA
jgi:hypothetical protein